MIRSEKTRQLIIEKTAAIFNKKGYTGTYLSDLTEATGLTKGSIYGNFKDKNEVAVEAFRYNYKFQSEKIFGTIHQINNSAEKIIALLNYYKTEFKPIFKNGGCAILNTCVDADDGNGLLKDEVTKSIRSWHKTIAQILKDGIRKKEIKNIEANILAYKIIALIEGSIMLAKTLENPKILIENINILQSEINKLRIQ